MIVVGYNAIITRDKETCSDEDSLETLESEQSSDLTICKKRCDKKEGCKYFNINDDFSCALYSSCSTRRISNHAGFTYEKNGNYFSTLCRNTLR